MTAIIISIGLVFGFVAIWLVVAAKDEWKHGRKP